ncbi:MAG: O-antigen ligase family protein [Alphaproteobacteria bacterium]|jgi:O-antigen ligase|nr:O-antigen ligase family protein [Alphaproteobacteria bacterium]
MTHRLFPFIWLSCFAAALMPLAAFEAQFIFVAVSLLAAAVSFVVLKHDFAARVTRMDSAVLIPVFAFWALALASVALSEIPTISLIYFGVFSLFPLSFCCALLAREKTRFFAVAGIGYALFAAGILLHEFVQFFMHGDDTFRAGWPFADANAFAGFLLPGLFAALGLMLGGKTRVHSNAGLVLAVLSAAGLMASGSRGGLVAAVLAFMIFVALSWPQIRHHRRCIFAFLVATAVLAILPGIMPEHNAGERIVRTFTGEEPVLWTRPAIWAATWQTIREHVWTGTGIGTFYLYYPAVNTDDYFSTGRMAHNDPLQFWAEMGVLAPLLFYAFIIAACAATRRALKNVAPDDQARIHIIAPFCALGALVLHAHVNFPFYIPATLMLAGIFMGYWFMQVRRVLPDAGTAVMRHRQALKIVLIVPLLAVLYGFMSLQASHIVFMRGDMRGITGDLEGFANDINKASRMAARKNVEAVLMAAQVNTAKLQAQGGIARAGAQQLHDETVALLDEAQKLNPRYATIVYTRGLLARSRALLGLEGEGSQETFFLEALALDPRYYPARIELARYYTRKKNKGEAFAVLEEGQKWVDAANVPDAYYEMLASSAMEQGRHDLSGFALTRLARSKREQPAAAESSLPGDGK